MVLGFAMLVTAHLSLAGSLFLFDKPRWRGLAALVLPPLAPIFGFRVGRKKTAIVWIAAVILYAIARIVAALV